MIKVDGLNKFYNKNKSNEIHVINDVTLELPNQGLISFLGASGSGKTTLLNVIGGLDKATGMISYDSFNVKNYNMNKIDKFRNEHIGYVFQSYNLLLTETVYDNLRIALELIDIYDENEVSNRIEYALKSVGMYKYRKKKASQLSGGQQQRVAIARALVKHCKIIIADEPTGNLDSSNALEVLNILKSISKKTLILLVTHNEALANFYSDYIYKIEDGRVVNHYENLSKDSLDTQASNVIYLKDLELHENKTPNFKIKLYSNNHSEIELEIVERNNTFYLKSNKNIKLIENSNIKLVDDHYKPVNKDTFTNYEYDNSFFNDNLKKKNIFFDLKNSFKRSISSFFKITKKTRFIYLSLSLIGIFFGVCAISLSNAFYIDSSQMNLDPNYSTIYPADYYYSGDDSEILTKALQEGYIKDVMATTYCYVNIVKKFNYVEKIDYNDGFQQQMYNPKYNSLICGEEPTGDDFAISEGVANLLLSEFSDYYTSYEDLIGLSVENYGSKISGVVKNPYKMMYISEYAYLKYLTSDMYPLNDNVRYYSQERKYDTYDIISGRDLTAVDRGCVLISSSYPNYEEAIGTSINEGVIVGVYELKGISSLPYEIMVNKTPVTDITPFKYSYEYEDYILVSGREPLNDGECLVSINSDLSVGSMYNGFEVVGVYNAKCETLKANMLFSTSALATSRYEMKVFIVENEEAFINLIGDEYTLRTTYQRYYEQLKQENEEIIAVFLTLGIICIILGSVLVYFLMRSKMLNDIYSIGVYRSLGANKNRIYLKYLIEIIVMVSFTAFITYLITMFIYFTAINDVNSFIGASLFASEIYVPILGVVFLYIINVFFGLLPIYTLLRKTPSEILAKYDI